MFEDLVDSDYAIECILLELRRILITGYVLAYLNHLRLTFFLLIKDKIISITGSHFISQEIGHVILDVLIPFFTDLLSQCYSIISLNALLRV